MSARKRNRELALTRALISRAHPSAIADDPDAMRLRSEEELKAGLDHVLKEHRADDGLWLFAYGSFMWKPEIEVAERRVATVRGWHRRFCLWQWRFRGTRDCPGVMLALDRGARVSASFIKLPALICRPKSCQCGGAR